MGLALGNRSDSGGGGVENRLLLEMHFFKGNKKMRRICHIMPEVGVCCDRVLVPENV